MMSAQNNSVSNIITTNEENTQNDFLMLIEESDQDNGSLIGYIPAYRLGVRGVSSIDLIENAKDLIKLKHDNHAKIFSNVSVMTLHVDF
ncbi:hypothetical protein ABE82_26950 (plasmid) [Paenibacillus peoriae]|uniref:hypothetical protein n=1 Tax=Paenibacillus peoriae TaxID=59893 RepID=UPI0007228675|nr:hypothetical protein [Paenibacillus peoriae]ALS10044.1 hypothetical protein ABE82_26950 [Paenibacillus peoriae]